MEIARVDTQGRVYLPKAIREAAGVGKETVLEVRVVEGKIILRRGGRASPRAARAFSSLGST